MSCPVCPEIMRAYVVGIHLALAHSIPSTTAVEAPFHLVTELTVTGGDDVDPFRQVSLWG